MAKKKKYYVVWQGHEPGIYDNWADCQAQIKNFPDAKYRAFPGKEDAEQAFREPWEVHYQRPPKVKNVQKLHANEAIIQYAISVDAACSGNPGKMEYRGVRVDTGEEVFRSRIFRSATNNIGEFLALVHALALYSAVDPKLTIYSDSKIAMGWVKKKKCNTKMQRSPINARVFDLIARAEKWLRENTYKNPILKWNTRSWGEIPADFGRK